MKNEPLGIAIFVTGMFATAVIIWLTGLNRFKERALETASSTGCG